MVDDTQYTRCVKADGRDTQMRIRLGRGRRDSFSFAPLFWAKGATGAATVPAIARYSFTDPSVGTGETAVGAPPALGAHTLE